MNQIVKVKIITNKIEDGKTTVELSGRDYSYFTDERLNVGDIIKVPVRDNMGDSRVQAKVVQIDVPFSEIMTFVNKVKTIPAMSKVTDPVPEGVQELDARIPKGGLTEAAALAGAAVKVVDLPEEPVKEETESTVEAVDIDVLPENNVAVLQLKERGERALQYAERFLVSDAESLKAASRDLALIRSLKDNLEKIRKQYVAPLNDKVKNINGFIKEITEPLIKADKLLRNKVIAYNDDIERQQREAAARDEEKYQLAVEQAKANNGEITVDLTPEDVPDTVKTIRSEIGTASMSGTWKYEVTDFAALPDEYKTVNTSALNSFVRSTKGTRTIPGVRIFFEKGLTVRGRG